MRTGRLPRAAAGLLAFILLHPAFISAGQDRPEPFTPPIRDAQGAAPRAAITSLEATIVGGVPQWISIRGHDVWNPVLLNLDGGPGVSHMAWNRHYLADLEKHFIVVNWDQRGTGKSFNSKHTDKLSLDQAVSDTIELARTVAQRFRQDRIYLVGHGVGAIVGTLAAQRHPELFNALVAVAPVVNPAESDQAAYRYAVDAATQAGDAALADRLRAQGAPPYTGKDLFARYLAVRDAALTLASSTYPPHDVRATMATVVQQAPEYSPGERQRMDAAAEETFTALYPQLAPVNLAVQVPALAVPVYFVAGRHDHTTDAAGAAKYLEMLHAPKKAFIWFEESGWAPAYEEPAKFVQLMVSTVLTETSRRRDVTD